jgi:hypothetical protein
VTSTFFLGIFLGDCSYADVATADMKLSGTESASEKLKSLRSVKNWPMTRLTMARATPDTIAAMTAMDSRM